MEMADQQIRNLWDFLLVYNKMTELCFSRCDVCLNKGAGKLIRSNHCLMGAYVKLMPSIVQRRQTEYENETWQLNQQAVENVLPVHENVTSE
uniref:Translocase of inner mitochondrial membrane 10B n=1 Tax=Erpetoichthys calabaricus TaxID=27687 RepID=A0A8C4X7J8_ERPCA